MITLTRLIRHQEMLIYLWAGWDVVCVGGPHERHSYLATKQAAR